MLMSKPFALLLAAVREMLELTGEERLESTPID